MRKVTIPIAAILLCAAALLAGGLSIAASPIQIKVVEDGDAVVGAGVDIITSDGVQSVTTDATGSVTVQISGKSFRVRVNGAPPSRAYAASESPVTITLP
jgi:hypothetical protein